MTDLNQKNFGISILKDLHENNWEGDCNTENIFSQYIQDLDFQIKNIGNYSSDVEINENDLDYMDDQLDFAIKSLNKYDKNKNKIENKYSNVTKFLDKYCN